MPNLSGELIFALIGGLVGFGVSWGTVVTKLSSLKEANSTEHAALREQLGELRRLEPRVSQLEGWRDGISVHPLLARREG